MKTYLITIQAVVVTDDPPTENAVEIMVGQDYPTITSSKVVEMVPKEPEPEPGVDRSRSIPFSRPEPDPEPVNCQTTLALGPSTPRSTRKISKGRQSRDRASLYDTFQQTEFFYSSQGYTSAARRIGVGTFEGPAPVVGVWLTKPERQRVKVAHFAYLQTMKAAK